MVELKLEPLDVALSKDFYVSVRVGEVQKLSRINAGRGYKFPSSTVGDRKFGKIEIFKKVGHASVGIVPDGADQEVRVELEDSSKVRFKVTLNGEGDKTAGVPVKTAASQDKTKGGDPNPKVQAAKAYLEQHNLEMRLSEAMQAVLREKPEDPAAFVAERLKKSAGMVQKMPKAEEQAAPAAAAAPAAGPTSATEAVSQVLPLPAYYNCNVKQCAPPAMEGIYSMFPAYNSRPVPAAPAAAPAAAAPLPPAAVAKPQEVAAAPAEAAKAAAPASAPAVAGEKSRAGIVQGLAQAAAAAKTPVVAAGFALSAASVAAAMPPGPTSATNPKIATAFAAAAMAAAKAGSATATGLTEATLAASLDIAQACAAPAKGKGASHKNWSDPTFCEKDADIHAPNYFKDYAEFKKALDDFPGELGLKTYLTEEIYNKYKDTKTKLGVTLDKCIKGGIDTATLGAAWNTGKVGLLLGDAECVETFADLVKPLILWRHGLTAEQLPHPPPNLDGSKLLDYETVIDDKREDDGTGRSASYVRSTRVRTGRSISGFALPPSISADQRKELEGIVTKALATLTGELKGDYYPLAGSTTYAPKPTGITKEVEEDLIKQNFLFQEPDEPMLLSWRMERDWPNARGIYHNEDKSALVWVNEEDHVRIISMEKTKNIRAVFDRFANLVKAVEAACVEAGKTLEIDPMYGNILSCPSNCGTGLRASMMIEIPLATKEPDFKKWCADRKLQARGSGGFASSAADDGVRDVSNVDRMGKDEVTLVNEMIQGVADLIKWEKELEAKAKAA